MESRRVILLSKGYLDGWLDFNYKNPLSTLREDFILNEIEKRELLKLRALRTQISSIVGAAIRTQESIQEGYEAFDKYRELALPYLVQKDKIEDNSQTDRDQLKNIKELLARKKKEILEKQGKIN